MADITSSDIVNKATEVAQEGRNVTYQVLDSADSNNKSNAAIKISNGPQSQIQNAQVP